MKNRRPPFTARTRASPVRLLVAAFAFAVAVAAACGGSIAGPGNGNDTSPSGDGGIGVLGRDGGRDARRDGTRDGEGDETGFVDPSCADAAPLLPQDDCDAYAQTGCGPGEACYPFVRYPTGPCERERYGTRCAPSGSGRQGDACGSTDECAGGYACIITGAGTSCGKLCQLGRSGACPEGQVCEPIDVAGYATCF